MKNKILVIFLLFVSVIIYAKTLDEIVAKVDKDVILRSELEKEKSNLKASGMLSSDLSDRDILNSMIENKIILKYANDNDFKVDDLKVKELANQQIKKMESQFKDEEEFENELKKETGLTLSELRNFYIESIKEEKLKQQVMDKVIKSKVNVTEAEISEYYKEHKDEFPKKPEADRIVMLVRKIEPGEKTVKEKLKKIKKIKELIESGESFEELAKKYSEGPSASNGGDLGFFEKGMMVKPFEDAAFKLKKGEVSDIVRTRFGFHIIKMIDKDGEKIRVRHILIKVEPTQKDVEKNLKLMNEALKKLRAGEDFNKVIKQYASKDTTMYKSGVIGDFPKDKYPQLFKDKLVKLNYGEYTDVIREGDFLYILGKLKKIPEREYTYDELYDKIRQKLMQEKQKKIYDKWISDQIKKVYVKIML